MTNNDLYDRIRAGWMGKSLGGAIGMPFEGVPYQPDLSPERIHLENVPNDDLELQLVWLYGLEQHGLALGHPRLAELWRRFILCGKDEYAVALRNMRRGVPPPYSGGVDNFFVDGLGAAIRSEIWAAVFAGRPDAAAHFAQLDAEVDHWGDGVFAERFLARAECEVLTGTSIEDALRHVFAHLPADSRLRAGLRTVFEQYDGGVPDRRAEEELLLHQQRHPNFTDCVMNLCFEVHALLRGGGDFARTVLAAVRFGRDTDCTGATCGAFLGFALGTAALPESWMQKLSEEILVGDDIARLPDIPRTIAELTERTYSLQQRFTAQLPAETYPGYTPCKCEAMLERMPVARYLIFDSREADVEQVAAELSATGRCPESMKRFRHEFRSTILDLESWAHDMNRLHLFTFIESGADVPDARLMTAADAGFTAWLDGAMVVNQHCRARMIPAFHRVEGGMVIPRPLAKGEKHLLRLTLRNCSRPLRCVASFGDLRNNWLTDVRFDI